MNTQVMPVDGTKYCPLCRSFFRNAGDRCPCGSRLWKYANRLVDDPRKHVFETTNDIPWPLRRQAI